MKRLFLAIPFDDAVQSALYDLALSIKGLLGGRAVRRGNYHCTLRFLGECGPLEEAAARQALSAIPAFDPFTLTFGEPDQFRQGGRALVWVGMENTDQLAALFDSLMAELGKAGFPKDNKKFLPHVTLLRDAAMPAAGKSLPGGGLPAAKFAGVVLFESVTGSAGLCYRPLAKSRVQ